MFRRRCFMCRRKTKRVERRYYYNDQGKRIIACLLCAEYAERRAYRRA